MNGFARIVALTVLSMVVGAEYMENRTSARNTLDSMVQFTPLDCSTGSGLMRYLLNVTSLEEFTRGAVQTSNFLTSVILNNNGSLDSLTDDIFFNLVESNVFRQTEDTLFYIALKSGVYSKFKSFAPYAKMKNGVVESDDLSFQYVYEFGDSYENLKAQNFNSITEIKTRRYTMRNHSHQYESNGDQPVTIKEGKMFIATTDDGYWSKPYFDCGASNKWIISFSSPILGRHPTSGKPEFKGLVSTDIDMTKFDVNQCDRDDGFTEDIFNNFFYGTHKCPATTRCQFKPGAGFTTGGYLCICQKGYSVPDTMATNQAFDGIAVENATKTTQFRCISSSESSRGTQNRMTACIFVILVSVVFSIKSI